MIRTGLIKVYAFTYLMIGTFVFFIPNLEAEQAVKLIAKDGLRYESISGELFTGIYEKFNESKILIEKSSYKEGKRDGYSSWYSHTGDLVAKRTYKAGKLHGRFESFHENGQLSEFGTYKNSLKEGVYRAYYANGGLKRDYVYRKGLKNGAWKEYYDSGELRLSGTSLNGRQEKVTAWNRDGSVKSQQPQ